MSRPSRNTVIESLGVYLPPGVIPTCDVIAGCDKISVLKRFSARRIEKLVGIYRVLIPDTAATPLVTDITLVEALTEQVHNISAAVIPGNIWILVIRDKFGTWFAVTASAACPRANSAMPRLLCGSGAAGLSFAACSNAAAASPDRPNS